MNNNTENKVNQQDISIKLKLIPFNRFKKNSLILVYVIVPIGLGN